jgi:hypothetical protein
VRGYSIRPPSPAVYDLTGRAMTSQDRDAEQTPWRLRKPSGIAPSGAAAVSDIWQAVSSCVEQQADANAIAPYS